MFLQGFIMKKYDQYLFFIQKFSGLLAQFSTLPAWVLLILFAMRNSHRLFIFGCVLKPKVRGGVSKLFFHSTVDKLAWTQRY